MHVGTGTLTQTLASIQLQASSTSQHSSIHFPAWRALWVLLPKLLPATDKLTCKGRVGQVGQGNVVQCQQMSKTVKPQKAAGGNASVPHQGGIHSATGSHCLTSSDKDQ